MEDARWEINNGLYKTKKECDDSPPPRDLLKRQMLRVAKMIRSSDNCKDGRYIVSARGN